MRVVPCGTGDPVLLSIRPERVSIAPEPGMYTNEFEATVDDVTFLGDHLRIRVTVCGQSDFIVKIPNVVGHGAVLEGDRIRIGWTSTDSPVLDDDGGDGAGMTRVAGRSVAAGRLAALASVMAATALASDCGPPPGESLTVISWGGSYAQAITRGYLEPLTAETGIEIRLDDYNGGLAQVRAQVGDRQHPTGTSSTSRPPTR